MPFGAIQSPLVSVIVINHNYGRFLSDCLSSIANQTYPYIECIVIDNGSTDDSLAVIAEAEARHFNEDGRRLFLIRMETNIFQTPAAVEAFKHAHGSFIIFFDADDYMLPACVEAHVRAMLYLRAPVGATCVDYFMSRDRELVTSTCSSDFVRKVGQQEKNPSRYFRRVEMPSTSRTGNDLDLDPLEMRLVDRKAYGWPWTGTSALCFRRELVELLFQRTPNLKAHLDAYLIGGINCLTGSVLIDRPLVVYRQHATNIFAAHPLLNNFYFFDRAREERAQTATQDEIVKTFAAVSGELAKRLLRQKIFIEAIATLATIWSGPPRLPRMSNYVIAFLAQNKTVLLKAFGRQTYRLWTAEFTMKALISFQLKSFFKGLKLLVSPAKMTH
jgi:glycosyltransferase involved in cell wall biosynthesis